MKMHPDCLRDKKLKDVPVNVPDSLLNEEQAYSNHSQTLKRLNERGGMGILEILDNIHHRSLTWREETQQDVNELNTLISLSNSNHQQ